MASDRFAEKIAAAQARKAAAKEQMRQAKADYQERIRQIDAQTAERLAAIDAQRTEAHEQRQADHDARQAEIRQQHPAPQPDGTVTFGKFILTADAIQRGLFDSRPLAGVTATVGELQRKKGRKTVAAARILTGSLAATAGALGRIGAKTLTITGPDWQWTAEVPAHKVEQAQAFADRVNAAARQHG